MAERVIKVFYNGECLPFKDKERVVHYPVAQGHIFMGASNTTEIRFYCDQIGGGNSQWIVIGKLPNGKRGFYILGDYLEDEDGGYYSFHLSQFFTQYKGDLYLSLGGYNGNLVQLNQEEEYELTGNTLIETTGSIRLTIEYSTPINGSYDEIDTWQEFLGALGNKADTYHTIITYSQKSFMDNAIDSYDNGQYFYCQDTQTIYRKIGGVATPVFTAYSKTESDSKYFINANNNTASGNNTFSGQNNFSGRAVFSGNANLYNTYLTTNTKNYFARVGTTTSQYVMYKLPYNYSDLGSEATYTLITKEYTDAQLALKVDKTTTINGYALSSNVSLTKSDIGLGNVVNTGDSDTPVNGGTTKFTTGGAYIELNKKADKATTLSGYGITNAYTKTEVDNIVDTIKSGELVIVNTITYPTLNDFLATTGEEGHIYLYPIDTNDLTKGYYRYVWENISGTNQWVSLGTTEIDLSDYYTKTQVNTLLGGKQDTIDSSHKLSADLVDDTSTTNKFVSASDITNWNAMTPQTRTIAGIDLSANISAQSLTDVLVFMNNTTDLDYVMED